MGVLATLQPRADQPQTMPQAQASDTDDVKPGFFGGVAASFRAAQDVSGWHQAERVGGAYADIVGDVARAAGKPVSAYLHHGMDSAGGAQQLYDADAIWADVAAARRRDGKAFGTLPASRGDFETQIMTRGGAAIADAQMASKASLTAGLLGGVGAAFTDPVNIVFGGAAGKLAGAGKTLAQRLLLEGLVNAGIETGQTPGNIDARARMGQKTTAGDVAMDIGSAFAMGVAMPAAAHGLGKAGRIAYDQLPIGLRAGRELSRLDLPPMRPDEVAHAFDAAVPEHYRTPDQAAALNVVRRAAEVDAINPYEATYAGQDLHQARLGVATERLLTGTAGRAIKARGLDPEVVSFFVGKGASEAQARGIAAGIAAESGNNPNAVNPGSGAFGLGQHLGPRRKAQIELYGENPTKGQQLEFLWHELTGGDHGGKHVLAQAEESAVLDAYVRKFMRPKAGAETDGDLARGMAALGRGEEMAARAEVMGDEVAGAQADLAAARAMDAEAGAMDAASMAARDAGAPEPILAGEPHPSEAMPKLQLDLFDTPEAHRAAQRVADADALGVAPFGQAPKASARASVAVDRNVPSLRPAVKWRGKIHKGPIGGTHEDAVAGLPNDARDILLWDADAKGFVDERGKFMDRFKAAEYAKNFDLIDRNSANFKGWMVRATELSTETPMKGAIPKAEMVRMWRGGVPDEEGRGGWYTTSRSYAEGYAQMNGGDLWTMDVPRDHPIFNNAIEGQGPENGFTFSGDFGPEYQGRRISGNIAPTASPDLAQPGADVGADPVGSAAQVQADGLLHDVRGDVEAGKLEGLTFAVGEGGEALSAAQALARLDADQAALDALKGCL